MSSTFTCLALLLIAIPTFTLAIINGPSWAQLTFATPQRPSNLTLSPKRAKQRVFFSLGRGKETEKE